MKGYFLGLVTLLFVLGQCVLAESYFVSVYGRASGDGSREAPWDLQTALRHPAVGPGDTVWVAGGRYSGVFYSELSGREGQVVVVRSIPGQEVVLDGNVPGNANGVLNIHGAYSWFWGLTVTNSAATGDAYFKDGVYFVGANSKLINCRIYNNGGNGVGFWRPALNAEIYGCVIYHNGYEGTARGHGHGIYSQNESGTKLIRDNVLFHSYGIGIHIYTENGAIDGYVLEGNVIFNSGIPGAGFIERNVLVGGMQPADRLVLRDNYFYNRPAFSSKASVQLGYAVPNRNAEFTNNVSVDGSVYILSGWNALQLTGNTLYSRSPDMQLLAFDDFAGISRPVFNNNDYYVGSLAMRSFSDWRDFSGQDAQSSFSATLPEQSNYHILTNRYEAQRAHIVVYNWSAEQSLLINLSGLLEEGADFEIYDVLRMDQAPVLSGEYAGGAVALPLTPSNPDLPLRAGSFTSLLSTTLPAFGVFLLRSSGHPDSLDLPLVPGAREPLKIIQCHPNPTVDLVVLELSVPSSGPLDVKVYDEAGRLVHRETFAVRAGRESLVLNLSRLGNGVYILEAGDRKETVQCKVVKRSFAWNPPDN